MRIECTCDCPCHGDAEDVGAHIDGCLWPDSDYSPDDRYRVALARIDALWGAPAGTKDGDELDALLDLVERHEAKHHPLVLDTEESLR